MLEMRRRNGLTAPPVIDGTEMLVTVSLLAPHGYFEVSLSDVRTKNEVEKIPMHAIVACFRWHAASNASPIIFASCFLECLL